MTVPLVDPQLAAFQASDPAAFLELGQPVPVPGTARPLVSRHDVEIALGVAIVTIALRIRRHLAEDAPDSDEDPAELARAAWRRHLPLWMRMTAPAIRRAYELGRVDGLTDAEMDDLAADYARHLGDYVNESSTEALAEGVQRQLNQRWSFHLAWRRASAAYGVDKQQMSTYLKGVAAGTEDSAELIPLTARTMADKLLAARGERIGAQEAYTAQQTGQALAWMLRYRNGELQGAQREWVLGADEHHCAVCTQLAGKRVRPDEPFVLGEQQVWAPRLHPGCECGTRLVNAAGEVIAKGALVAAGIAVLAEDTGRVLMIQRAQDGQDPAGGMWEFPGGHIEDGETPFQGARREWEEEVHRRLPGAEPVAEWTSGVYRGFVVRVRHEAQVPSHRRGSVVNPDDPDGDDIEAIAWWDPAHLQDNPAVRAELRAALPKVRRALGPIAKNRGDDPFNRDPHGRFAAMEQRRSSVQLAAPDPEIMRLLDRIERAPRSLTEARPSLTGRARTAPLTGQSGLTAARPSSLTQAPSLTQAVPLTQTAAPAQVRAPQRTPLRAQIHIHLPPALPPPPPPAPGDDPIGEGNYVSGADLQSYFDDMGIEHGDSDFVDFGEIGDYYREQGSSGRIPAARSTDVWSAAGPQVAGYSDTEWGALMATAQPVWQEAIRDHDRVLAQMTDQELRTICARAFRGILPSADGMRDKIRAEIQDPDAYDHSLRDAYADMVTWSRPDYLESTQAEEFDRFLAQSPERSYIEAAPPVLYRFASFQPGDGPQHVQGYYEMANGRYVSALAQPLNGRSIPKGHLNAELIELDPSEDPFMDSIYGGRHPDDDDFDEE